MRMSLYGRSPFCLREGCSRNLPWVNHPEALQIPYEVGLVHAIWR